MHILTNSQFYDIIIAEMIGGTATDHRWGAIISPNHYLNLSTYDGG